MNRLGRQQSFRRGALLSFVALLLLAGFDLLPLGRGTGPLAAVRLVRDTIKTRGLSAEAREEATAGYYQELLNGASEVVVRTPSQLNQFVGGREENNGPPRLEELDANTVAVNDYVRDFLIYRPRPNLRLRDPRFNNVEQRTNSFGYSDQEYALAPDPNTWRVVLLGDSMARGLGVAPGEGFEPHLETFLNGTAATGNGRRVEILNMGVSGYRLTQIVDIALQDAPRFKPDSYVLVVSWLTVARKWGLHLAQLIEEGIDLKYDFLRGVARDARLRKGDSAAVSEAKLAPFMVPTFRWVLDQLVASATSQGASVGVILIPHLKGIGSYEADFGPIRQVLTEAGVPVVDLLDAFDDADITTLDVGDGLHPNAAGHQILLSRLKARLAGDPRAEALFTGPPGSTTVER